MCHNPNVSADRRGAIGEVARRKKKIHIRTSFRASRKTFTGVINYIVFAVVCRVFAGSNFSNYEKTTVRQSEKRPPARNR